MIVASVRVLSKAQALADMEEARRGGADAVELRLDEIADSELVSLMPRKTLPVIATCRPHWEGGRFHGTEEERLTLLREAARLGADYVDLEFKAFKDIPLFGARRILSYHDFDRMPASLESIVSKMEMLEPFAIKIAVRPAGMADVLKLLHLQRSVARPSTILALDEIGEPLRILYRKYGAWMTYASLRVGFETAPGQVPLGDLHGLYHAGDIDEETVVYAVVGNPVAYSRGPELFNAAFHAVGMNARYVRVQLDDPMLFRDTLDGFGIHGASVTRPHKERVAGQLDEVDDAARAIGAVNTVWKKNGRWVGANTDAYGAVEALREGIRGKHSSSMTGLAALVLGAGGVARAMAWGLKREGVSVTVCARRREQADRLAVDLGVRSASWDQAPSNEAELVVNATPIGMDPHREASPVSTDCFQGRLAAFDAVYTPRRTAFLRDAEAAGLVTIDGVKMFQHQAVLQFECFTGRPFPRKVLEEFDRASV